MDVSYYLYCLISTHYLIITHAGIRKGIAVTVVSNHFQILPQALLQIAVHVLVSSAFRLTADLLKALMMTDHLNMNGPYFMKCLDNPNFNTKVAWVGMVAILEVL